MVLSISNVVKDFFNSSSVPAMIVDNANKPLWFNNAFDACFEHFHDTELFLKEFGVVLSDIKVENSCAISANKRYGIDFVVKTSLNLNNLSIISFVKAEQMMINPDSDVLQRLFDNSYEMLFVFNSSTLQVINANKSFANFIGVPAEHIVNIPITKIFSDDMVLRFIQNRKSVGTFFLMRYKSLTSQNYMLEVNPTYSEGDDIVIFHIRDVTGQSNLRDEKYQDILINSTMTDGVIIYEDDKVKSVNDIACKIWGYEKSEMIGLPLTELYSENESYENSIKLVNRHDVAPMLFVGVRKDGSEFNGKKISRTIISRNKPTYVVVVNDDKRDVTFHRAIEARTAYEQRMLDVQKHMIAVYNKSKMAMCNKAFLDFFGYKDMADFNEQYIGIYSLFLDEKGCLEQSKGEGWLHYIVENKDVEHKVLLQGANRKEPCIFVVTVDVIDAEEEKFFVTFSDITEMAEHNLILKDVNDLLVTHSQSVTHELKKHSDLLIQQEKMATMGEMMGVITHQWKQPLNAIGLISQNVEEMLEDDDLDRQEIASMMASIMKQVVFMGETVDNFREFFKPNNQSVAFNLVGAIKSTLMLINPLLKRNQVVVDVVSESADTEKIRIQGFPNEFKQVVMNIIVNSKDAIQSKILESNVKFDGKVIIVVEHHFLPKNEVVITFKDNGTGFSEQGLKKVFELNFTTKGNAGTGIGLYMVKMITEKMKGSIEAKNWEGGAAIILHFPVSDMLGK